MGLETGCHHLLAGSEYKTSEFFAFYGRLPECFTLERHISLYSLEV